MALPFRVLADTFYDCPIMQNELLDNGFMLTCFGKTFRLSEILMRYIIHRIFCIWDVYPKAFIL